MLANILVEGPTKEVLRQLVFYHVLFDFSATSVGSKLYRPTGSYWYGFSSYLQSPISQAPGCYSKFIHQELVTQGGLVDHVLSDAGAADVMMANQVMDSKQGSEEHLGQIRI